MPEKTRNRLINEVTSSDQKTTLYTGQPNGEKKKILITKSTHRWVKEHHDIDDAVLMSLPDMTPLWKFFHFKNFPRNFLVWVEKNHRPFWLQPIYD
jgi:hypothetical protein